MIPDSIRKLFSGSKPKDPVAEKQRSDLQQAELELLEALSEVEDWSARVRARKARVARLKGLQADPEPAPEAAQAVEEPTQ